ncbi:brevican core protein-like [Macrobrachium nipponense]|uniref:brevican core protein-like n=1 Tax=Macrobrachium nipponense TaxID=159736 RepID=UPI0030C8A6A6
MSVLLLLAAVLPSFGSGSPSPTTTTFLRVADDLESPTSSDISNVTLTTCGIECFKAGVEKCLGFQWKPYTVETNAAETASASSSSSTAEDCTKPPIVGSDAHGQCGFLECVPKPSSLVVAAGSQIYLFRGKGNLTYGSLIAPKSYRMACTYAYRIFDKMKMTYAEAETQCQMDGAKLMPVKNPEEQALLSGQVLYGEGYWIGLTDKESEGRFVDSDGKLPTYTNWDSGQPNNFAKNGEDQDCVMLFQKKWNDNQCSTRLNFVCQISFLEL